MDRDFVVVDVESDGPCPGTYSMIEIGAVVVSPESLEITKTFHSKIKPITDAFVPEALRVSCPRYDKYGRSACFVEPYRDVAFVMRDLYEWLQDTRKPLFVSDNNGFDWQFVNYYFWRFCGENPFGHSSMNLGSFYKGYVRDLTKNFKHLRDTRHTHNALDDAMGNAEALIKIMKEIRRGA